MKPLTGISIIPEVNSVIAMLPLFDSQEIECVEWSFDTLPQNEEEPMWLSILLDKFAKSNRLLGHGVRYSLLHADWTEKQENWLRQAEKETRKRNYRHVTEHFGFMSSDDFHKGAPLPVPLNEKTLRIGKDRLMRLQAVTQSPVGLENLAFAFGLQDVKRQGEFIDNLLEPVNGFVLMDLHNIWCQAVNFDLDPTDILRSYPLNKVRELHMSGGSWSVTGKEPHTKKVRRDTHDEAVPPELFELLEKAMQVCPHIECVILERMGNTMTDETQRETFRQDFKKIKTIASGFEKTKSGNRIIPVKSSYLETEPVVDANLSSEQNKLVKLLKESKEVSEIVNHFKSQMNENWQTHEWQDHMIETAMDLIRKWS